MTDNKSWLWRKKSSEKAAIAAEKAELASRENEQIHVLLAEKAELERDLKDLGDKLSSALSECSAKDDLAKKHSKTAKEALAGWEKAEAKALSLKEELDEALKERDNCEDRARHLDAALKECMQQLRFVREEKEQRINDVLQKASEELEETKMFLEGKLEESGKTVAKFTAENSQLCKAILLKDQLIEELKHEKAKVEADVNALLGRLELSEKDNNSLRYELRVLEKEVDIRNEEREFNRRTADASHKQHLENVKKIAKLESECQRLRLLVRKRLPGPAALAKMKTEVDLLGRDSADNRRKKSNLSTLSSMQLDYGVDSYLASPGNKIDLLTEKICSLEEENESMKEILEKKTSELQILSNMYIQAASKISQLEAQLDESQKSQLSRDNNARSSMILHDQSLASMSDVGSDDKVSCAGSWASKSAGISDMNHLMDDFAEMEKLALVCVDKPIENSSITNNGSIGKELVPITLESDATLQSKLSKPISRLIEIIHGINCPSGDHDALETPKDECDYTLRVFQWRTSELTSILQNFLHACDDLVNGKAVFETFSQELTYVLEWIVNHCISLQDATSVKHVIKKQFGCDEAKSEREIDVDIEEGTRLKEKQELEYESLRNELEKSEKIIARLQIDMDTLKHSKEMIEEQLESHRMMNEDLNSQLLAAGSRMDEAHKKIASLQAEVESKVNHGEGLESKCFDLPVQHKREQKEDTLKQTKQEEKQLRTEWEISAASEKLAECQETILNLGKQLQAMQSSQEVAVSDKFMSTPSRMISPATPTTPTSEKKLACQRSSLLDKMQAEDNSETEPLESPKTKEMIYAKDYRSISTGNNTTAKNNELDLLALAIVPSKKAQTTSGGLFKKLLRRKKKVSSKKMPLPFGAV